jgi:DNA-binding CsgD family transcriptional regulator
LTRSLARAPVEEHRNPFGAAGPDSEAKRTPTIADVIGHCRWIALDINAAAFSLFVVGPAGERNGLVPLLDPDHPSDSSATIRMWDGISEEIVRHARTSALPLWWAADGSASADAFLQLPMAKRLNGPSPAGIAFPVSADRGRCGLVAFLGSEIALSDDQCLDVHARCYSLFGAAMRIRPDKSRKAPAVSKRELECLKLSANGMTSEQIAASLKLSVHTANQYLTNSTQKLNAANRTHAVAKALKLGLFE